MVAEFSGLFGLGDLERYTAVYFALLPSVHILSMENIINFSCTTSEYVFCAVSVLLLLSSPCVHHLVPCHPQQRISCDRASVHCTMPTTLPRSQCSVDRNSVQLARTMTATQCTHDAKVGIRF